HRRRLFLGDLLRRFFLLLRLLLFFELFSDGVVRRRGIGLGLLLFLRLFFFFDLLLDRRRRRRRLHFLLFDRKIRIDLLLRLGLLLDLLYRIGLLLRFENALLRLRDVGARDQSDGKRFHRRRFHGLHRREVNQ